MKSILFTCADFGGGIGKMLRFVSSICVEHFSFVGLLHRGRESDNDFIPKGVHEYQVVCNRSTFGCFWRIDYIKQLRSQIKQIKPDIVCCFGSEQAVMIAMALIGLKNIVLVQCERGDPYTVPTVWKPFIKWSFRKADFCVFQLHKQGEWYGNKVMSHSKVIPNAFIPTGHIKPYNGSRNKTIVSVGRFVYEKRYEVLLDAFMIVHTKHEQYKLIIYGDGPYREKYKSIVSDYNLNDYVEFPGYIDNAMNIISSAEVFVLPSLYEGMPNSLIEALAVGIPTVSTNCTPGGPDFLTEHGKRGILVPVNDASAMADAICQIIENKELSTRLSKLGPEVVSILGKDKITNEWINFLKGI